MIAYTAIYGGYDVLKPHPSHDDVTEWRCYTDDETLTDNPRGWHVVVEPLPYPHPRLSAKWWKCHPPAGRALWLDGSVELISSGFIDEVSACLNGADMAMWVHPWRDCIFEEALASLPMTKYQGLPVHTQVDHYASLGWRTHAGLWASTVIGWGESRQAREMGAAWFAHNELATYQDQLSLPVLLERYGVKVAPLPGAFVDLQWVRWRAHRSNL